MSASSPRHPAPAYSSAGASRAHPYARRRSPAPAPREERLPPSPPRSHLDSGSPPADKLDPADNYWDDVPAAPASLKSILDSFRRSGEGDRDLLLAILGAKKSEEERLTCIIQTRLTILQARLNLAAIQAQMPCAPEFPEPSTRQERTPSLSNASSADSPRQYYYQPREERVQLPPIGFYGRDRSERLAPMRETSSGRQSPDSRAGGLEMLLEGVREAERKDRN